jgi:hypothetical protein
LFLLGSVLTIHRASIARSNRHNVRRRRQIGQGSRQRLVPVSQWHVGTVERQRATRGPLCAVSPRPRPVRWMARQA